MVQTSLFGDDPKPVETEENMPLAGRMRPRTFDDFAGQKHLIGEGRILRNMIEQDRVTSMIFWGPPGVGKTTLATIIANYTKAEFVQYSAVTGGAKEVKEIMAAAEKRRVLGRRTILFVDEIHRFNKAQQDAFLPFVEKGSIILIGATTENPSFQVNSALLSRCKVFVLEGITADEMCSLIKRAATDPKGFPDLKVNIDDGIISAIAQYSNGDARTALNTLEAAVANCRPIDGAVTITKATLEQCISRRSLLYDRDGEEHYNIISALHKSMRNSDPDAAIYWLARMLDGGEDPCYIARRLIEFAGDDVGLADPNAQVMATSCFYACKNMGMPDCRYALAETVAYLALAPRSNSIAMAIDKALSDVRNMPAAPVPMHIRNAPTKLMKQLGYGKDYQYAEGTEEKITKMECLPESMKGTHYYEPGDKGNEVFYRKRLDAIRDWRAGKREDPPR
ncbi:MAG: replication-associated recombination protein A [archaeon]|nr:replication-associated recombination protein A [archaeon]